MSSISRLAKVTKGLRPRYVRQLYHAVVIPSMLYAADVFLIPSRSCPGARRASGTVGLIKTLCRVQRDAGIVITGALRSTAQPMLDAHANLLPFRIFVRYLCG